MHRATYGDLRPCADAAGADAAPDEKSITNTRQGAAQPVVLITSASGSAPTAAVRDVRFRRSRRPPQCTPDRGPSADRSGSQFEPVRRARGWLPEGSSSARPVRRSCWLIRSSESFFPTVDRALVMDRELARPEHDVDGRRRIDVAQRLTAREQVVAVVRLVVDLRLPGVTAGDEAHAAVPAMARRHGHPRQVHRLRIPARIDVILMPRNECRIVSVLQPDDRADAQDVRTDDLLDLIEHRRMRNQIVHPRERQVRFEAQDPDAALHSEHALVELVALDPLRRLLGRDPAHRKREAVPSAIVDAVRRGGSLARGRPFARASNPRA